MEPAKERPPATVSLISRLLRKGPDPRETVRPLWHRIVEIAREKAWYAQCGIADTVPGRFDAVTLVLALVMLRMERGGALINHAAKLTELFVDDMDGQLRQSGVGDLVVGKRMGKLVSVLGGRIGALRDGLAQDDAVLAAALERNVTLIDGTDPAPLVARVRALHAQIDALSEDTLIAASIDR